MPVPLPLRRWGDACREPVRRCRDLGPVVDLTCYLPGNFAPKYALVRFSNMPTCYSAQVDHAKDLRGTAAHPRMVTLLREARAWSQVDLAAAAGISQGFLSKVEGGHQDLRDARLIDVAKALGCPPTLLLDDAPIRGIEITCLHHRKRGSRINVTSKKQIEAVTHLVRVSINGLMQDVDLHTDLKLPNPHELDEPRDSGESGPSPKDVARDLRAAWGLAPGPVPNVMALLERAGVLVHVRSLGTSAQDAVSSWPAGGLPVMVVNAGLPGDRERFTVCHELGHLLMHTAPSDEQEREANEFAAEFLAPAGDIRADLAGLTTRDFPRLVKLKGKWRISIAALIARAHDIGCITDRQYREFHIRLNKLGWTPMEPGTLDREQPEPLDRVVDAHLSLPGATVEAVAAKAQMTEPAFRYFYAKHREVEHRPLMKVSTARD